MRFANFVQAGNFPHPHSSRPVGYTNAKSLLEGIKEVFRMVIDKIALALAIIGALNYALVGLAGLWCITLLFRSSDEETGHARHTA